MSAHPPPAPGQVLYEREGGLAFVPDTALAEETRKCADRILRGAPLAARINKRTLRRLECGDPLEDDEYPGFFSYADSHDHQEGVRAFLAGEEPTFSGD